MPNPTVAFEWVNNGEPFTLRDIPAKGAREVRAIKRKQAKLLAEYSRALFLNRAAIILGVKKILDGSGIADAKRAWDSAVSILANSKQEQIIWPIEEFPAKFDGWLKDVALRGLDAKDVDEAHKKCEEGHKSLDNDLLAKSDDLFLDAFTTELYWRLKGDFAVIRMRDGDGWRDVPLTVDAIEEVARWPEDFTKLRGLSEKDEDPINTNEIIEQLDESGVKKN